MLSEEKPKQYNHRVALFGLGGVGKTQIAIEYVNRYKFRYNAVFWISAADRAGLLSGYQEIAQVIGCTPLDSGDAESTAKNVLMWLKKQQNWLLVLDNMDDTRGVRPYLPHSTRSGHILITTRHSDATGIQAQGLKIDVFTQEEARDFLILRTGLAACEKTQSEAVKIVIELGFLALAIEQAAAYIRVTLKNIFKFLDIYANHRQTIFGERPEQNWENPVVATTWSMSFAIVKKNNPDAEFLLNLFAFLNPDEILIEFLEAGVNGLRQPLKAIIENSHRFIKAVGDLDQLSLVSRNPSGTSVSIHRLVQAVLRDRLEPENERKFMEIAVELMTNAFPLFHEESNRQICRKYQDQALGPLRGFSELRTKHMAYISSRLGYFLLCDGKPYDAEFFGKLATDIFTQKFRTEHPDTLTSMNNLASTYRALGRTNDAMALQETVLEVRRRILAKEHPDTLTIMNNLALTYRDLGRTSDAMALQETVLEVRRLRGSWERNIPIH